MTNPTAILQDPARQTTGKQNSTLFRIYIGYRTLLSVVLLIMLVSPKSRELVGVLNPTLYVGVALVYLVSNIVLLLLINRSLQTNQTALFAVFFIDIVAISLMADASKGMVSGLPILLVISVAASAVLVRNRTVATLIAALSVIAILADTTRLITVGHNTIESLFPSGLLGLLIFGVSLLVQVTASRLRRAEALARSRTSDLYNLQRLNEQIVHHMQTGILLVDAQLSVRITNKAATTLLAPNRPATLEQGRQLRDYNAELATQFSTWKETGLHRAAPIEIEPGAPQIIANFHALQSSKLGESLIFIDDYSPVTQYAQSLKLTSLGRLTASIAHEIRNPLGAVSHAAQLLQESTGLNAEDRHMADIIQDHSRRMNDIIESVMQISRREPPEPEYLPLANWLQDFVHRFLDAHDEHADIIIDCEYQELLVEFDNENLQRVLTNLLENAFRHTKMATGKEWAHITVSLDDRTPRCFIDIIDGGTGVTEVNQTKLFEPFYTTVKEGSGMGLFLCKELCEINNADLSYRHTASGESCFRVTISKRG